MRKVLLDFDDRITGSIEFMFDVDLLLKMSKNIIDKQIEDKELENEFIRLYVKVVDGYNRYVTAYNKAASKLSRKRR
ncbi:MAG: hypothetical protein TH68_10915 [Candidatus Synechococcus spongiarum 142]|uniref:Uncharacterized protein n=1 Tax=Candidatus Synechococcus spongiarum 142 TaxID=1608213 RepID=A0A6N3X3M7_9SYNE|nr:MAG: hypothetical protein TH68_10915 [Candidatus Synechococcus spongiarum 142]